MSLEFTESELKSLRAEYCKGFTDEQAGTFFAFCRVRNLLPGKHILAQLRRSKEWDEVAGAKIEVTKIVFITTIDASRLIAQRTGQYGGQAPEQYIYLDENGAPSIVSDIPLPKLPVAPGQTALPREPWAVRTTLYRKDFDHPVISIARFDAYASTYKTANGPVLNEMWTRRGPEQLAKCSEMLSLRRGWPEELGGIYLDIELKNENEEVPVVVVPASVVPQLPTTPSVNQTPATPTEAPRPGEQPKVEYHADKVPATLPEHSGPALVVKPMPVETAKSLVENLPMLEKVLDNPAIQKQLADEGKKIDTEAIARVKTEAAAILAAVPDLKTATELPTPAKKKAGRPKASPPPVPPVVEGITQADVDNVEQNQAPVVDEAADQAAAQEFVESLDPTPTQPEMKEFTARVRALTAAGAVSIDLKNYILNVGQKSDTKQLTVGNWNTALGQLEDAQKAGTLKEITKNAPLPTF